MTTLDPMETVMISLLGGAIRASTPYLFVSLGECITETSGRINLGQEGILMLGAMTGYAISYETGNPWLGVLFAGAAGAALGALHAFACGLPRVNDIAIGIAVLLFGTGLAFLVGKPFIQPAAPMLPALELGWWSDTEAIRSALRVNALFFVGVALTFLLRWGFFRLRWGLVLRTVGDSADAARALGFTILRARFVATVAGAFLSGVGGAFLSLYYPGSWTESLSSGQGLMAVALVIFARWDPLRCLWASLLFGAAGALGPALQSAGIGQVYYLVGAAPYALTLVILVASHSRERRAIGAPRELRRGMTDALALEAINIRKRFGDVVALGGVSLKVREGSVHALLGENGAGKSTLVKCLTGYYTPDEGQFIVAGRELVNRSPREALRAGIGMVYQHFTLVPGMTVAENLLLARSAIPFAIGWREFEREIERRLASMPFRVPLQAQVSSLSAGEKQKVEILKQLLMNRRLLVLDEPSSVLTPQESDDVLGALRLQAEAGALTVVLITHKFREVRQFADDVTVLRHGAVVGGGPAETLSDQRLAELMVGAPQETAAVKPRARAMRVEARLRIAELRVRGGNGAVAVDGVSLSVASGEILGVAGVSGNGQRELVEALAAQRVFQSGSITVDGEPFARNRAFMRRHRIAVLPEEPSRNACVAEMSVAENLAMRAYDEAPLASGGRLARWRMRPDRVAAWARGVIQRNAIRAGGPESPVNTLSGGNVQRLVLARELGERGVGLLIAANPCFGLDFAAAARIRDRIRAVRDDGAAVLLISEDLDEVLDIADRIAVMSSGRVIYQTARAGASRNAIGQAMAGATHGEFVEGNSAA